MRVSNSPIWDRMFELLSDPSVSEVESNAPDKFFIKKSGKRIYVPEVRAINEKAYMESIRDGLAPFVKSSNVFDPNGYLFEGRMTYTINGIEVVGRCHIVLPPACDFPQVTIAKKTASLTTLESIAGAGSMSTEMMRFLEMAVSNDLTIAFSGGTGAGKAQILSTPVPTPGGWKTIGSIRCGDRIFDRHGEVGLVTNIFHRPNEKVFCVTLSTGEKKYVAKDHNWLVRDSKDKDDSLKVLTTGDIIGNGLYHDVHGENDDISVEPRFHVPTLDSPVRFDGDDQPLPVHPYVLGLALGWCNSRRENLSKEPFYTTERAAMIFNHVFSVYDMGFSFVPDQDLSEQKIFIPRRNAIPSDTPAVKASSGNAEVNDRSCEAGSRTSMLYVLNSGNAPVSLKDILEAAGVDSSLSIPLLYEMSSVESRDYLVRGILDASGNILFNKSHVFAVHFEGLKNSVYRVVNSLGLVAVLEEDENGLASVKILTDRKMTLTGLLLRREPNIDFGSDLPIAEVGFYGSLKERSIVDIVELDRREDMICLSVDTSDHTFLSEYGYITDHNTTMMESMTKYFSNDDRIGVAEDTPELKLVQDNVTYLHSTPWQPGMDENDVATLSWVVQQFQRMRTDKVIVGEVRGKEFADFLTAANSGMEGSMITIHADNPSKCLTKMTNFALRGSERQPIRAINTDIAEAIDIIVQLVIDKGRHRVSAIQEVVPTLGNTEEARITTEPLYLWDRQSDMFYKAGMMTDNLRKKLLSKGVNLAEFISSDIDRRVPAHKTSAAPVNQPKPRVIASGGSVAPQAKGSGSRGLPTGLPRSPRTI